MKGSSSLILMLIVGFTVIAHGLDSCELKAKSNKIFIKNDETQMICLDDYFQGQDLKYALNDTNLGQVIPSIRSIAQAPIDLPDYTVLNVDSLHNASANSFQGQGLIFAQLDPTNIAIINGTFRDSDALPTDLQTFKYTLPQKAKCFDAKFINPQQDIAINCIGVEQTTNMLCIVEQLSNKISCQTENVLFSSAVSRESIILYTDFKPFLLSINVDKMKDEKYASYISIYNIVKGNFVFNNIIDGSSLDYPWNRITIADVVVDTAGNIYVADSFGLRVVTYNFNSSNGVTLKKLTQLKKSPSQLSLQGNTLIVSTRTNIFEYNIESQSLLKTYVVDETDNQFIEMQANANTLLAVTHMNNLYVYQRSNYNKNILQKVLLADSIPILRLSEYLPIFNIYSNLNKAISIMEVNTPSLQLQNLPLQTTAITVTAKSLRAECSLSLQIKVVQNNPGGHQIFTKDVINSTNLMVQDNKKISIKLDQYFGGLNLEYKVPASIANKNQKISNSHLGAERSDENDLIEQLAANGITATVDHMKTQGIESALTGMKKTAVLEINSTAFYLIGADDKLIFIEECASKEGAKVVCNKVSNFSSMTAEPLLDLIVKKRSNGDYVVLWTKANKNQYFYVYIKKQIASGSMGGLLEYSSATIGDNGFIYLVSKKSNLLTIHQDSKRYNPGTTVDISESDLSAADLKMIGGGFYPRAVLTDPLNPNIFYIKLQTSLVTATVVNRVDKMQTNNKMELKILSVRNILSSFVLENQWTVFQGKRSLLSVLLDSVTEYARVKSPTKENVVLQKITFANRISGVRFDGNTDMAYISTSVARNNEVQNEEVTYLKLGEAGIDTKYHALSGTPSGISGSWLIDANTKTAYYVKTNPLLNIQGQLNDEDYKKDFTLEIDVSSGENTVVATSKVTVSHTPMGIKNTTAANNQIVLPLNASLQEIILPIETYFNGPISGYTISCPYCVDEIKLLTAFRKIRQQDNVGDLVDMTSYKNQAIIGVSSRRYLYVINQNNTVIGFEQIESMDACTQVEYVANVGLFVYCLGGESQYLLKYTLIDAQIIAFTLEKTYQIPSDQELEHADSMSIYSADGNKLYVYILDNDIYTEDDSSQISNLKIFFIVGQNLSFVRTINHATFAITKFIPINGFTISHPSLLLTLGAEALGYIQMSDDGNWKISTLNLKSQAEIASNLIAGSEFKSIKIIEDSKPVLKVFITTTTSLHFVLELIWQDNVLGYSKISESYYRYSNQIVLDLLAVDEHNAIISYYSVNTSETSICIYTRSSGKMFITFRESFVVRTSNQRIYNHAAAVFNGMLWANFAEKSIYSARISNNYSLWLNYSNAANFTSIQVKALSKFSSAEYVQSIKFDVPDVPEEGLKWYVILIAVLVMLLVVGLAFGLYCYMKAQRAKKSVSLLTENEEVDEEV